MEKLKEVESFQLKALDHLRAAGAKIGFGTDLLGEIMPLQSKEFALRLAVCTPLEILRSATSVNADILQRRGELGVLVEGAFADILVIDGNPLADISVLENHARIQVILRNGEVIKNAL
jgi:imidazolonepropionase-like amidohydrolase